MNDLETVVVPELAPPSVATAAPDPSPSPETKSEPTDDDLRETMQKARARVTIVMGNDAPAMDQVAIDLPRSLPGVPIRKATTLDLETWEPTCVACRAPLGYRIAVNRYGPVTECADCRSGSITARLESSGISYREIDEPLASLVSSGPEFDRWMAFLRSFASLNRMERLKPPFAFVCGNNGVGKSAGAQRAMRDAIRNGCSGRFVRFSELITRIYSTYGRGDRDERTEDVIRLYASIHLLVIDEVGLETPSENAMALFFDFVDDRWKSCLPTIFTSNYLLDESSLGAHMTERAPDETRMRGVLDRIRGGTGANVFVLKGKSWRGKELAR